MRKSYLIVIIFLFFAVSGCATTRYPTSYKVCGSEVRDFTQLDDEKALELVAMIYNIKAESWEDTVCRNFSLQEYIGLLSKRKSRYLDNSGVFKISYEKVDLRKWKDEDLIKLYQALKPKTCGYYLDASAELNETQNTERIAYLTTQCAIATEMKSRASTRNFMSVATHILMGVLTIALSVI